METLLPLILLVVGVVIVLPVIYFLRRRRMASSSDELPEIGTPIDYTAETAEPEEPATLGERFANLSIAGKILVFIVPVLFIVGAAVMFLALGNINPPPEQEAQPEPEYEIQNVRGALANPNMISISAETNLPQDTEVSAEVLADGELFEWYDTAQATGRVDSRSKIDIRLTKLPDAASASEDVKYTVRLSANIDGKEIENVSDLVVPPSYAAAFYAQAAAQVEPTAEPTPEPVEEPEETEQPEEAEPTPEPEPEGPPPVTAVVFNGGNVRSIPQINGSQVLDQINAAENVQLLQKTPDNQWYLIKNIRDVVGWVSSTLLTIAPETAAQVPAQGQGDPLPTAVALGQPSAEQPNPPQQPTTAPAQPENPAAEGEATGLVARVFNGGNVRSAPQLSGSQVLDQIHAGEIVQLLQKTANNQWYQIRNPRNVVGWVNVTLLTIDQTVASRVPVAP